MAKKNKIAVLVSFSGQGGVERSFALLVNEMAALGIEVDLLLIKRKSPHLAALSPAVNQIPLKHQHAATCVGEVATSLRTEEVSGDLTDASGCVLMFERDLVYRRRQGS